MIIADYRKKITTDDIISAYLSLDEELWENLGKSLNQNKINLSNIDINKLIANYDFITNFNYIDSTFKMLLEKCDTSNITKYTFSCLLCLEGDDKEYIEILKDIVNSTNEFNNIYLFDYEDNDYDHDKSKKLINKASGISVDDLYPAYYSSVFKTKSFNPVFITNLTSPVELTEEYCKESDLSIILY